MPRTRPRTRVPRRLPGRPVGSPEPPGTRGKEISRPTAHRRSCRSSWGRREPDTSSHIDAAVAVRFLCFAMIHRPFLTLRPKPGTHVFDDDPIPAAPIAGLASSAYGPVAGCRYPGQTISVGKTGSSACRVRKHFQPAHVASSGSSRVSAAIRKPRRLTACGCRQLWVYPVQPASWPPGNSIPDIAGDRGRVPVGSDPQNATTKRQELRRRIHRVVQPELPIGAPLEGLIDRFRGACDRDVASAVVVTAVAGGDRKWTHPAPSTLRGTDRYPPGESRIGPSTRFRISRGTLEAGEHDDDRSSIRNGPTPWSETAPTLAGTMSRGVR